MEIDFVVKLHTEDGYTLKLVQMFGNIVRVNREPIGRVVKEKRMMEPVKDTLKVGIDFGFFSFEWSRLNNF